MSRFNKASQRTRRGLTVLVITALAVLAASVVALSATRQKGEPAVTSHENEIQRMHTQFNPCTLVSLAQARAISHGAVYRSMEVPLGPTCIYKLRHSRSEITMTVELLRFNQVTGPMHHRQGLSIHRRRVFCGRLGNQMLFARLANGRVLNITAPCGLARRFAAVALRHVS